MANFNLNISSAVYYRSIGGTFQSTTTTPFITPSFDGSNRVYSSPNIENFSFAGLGSSYDFESPGRPGSGQLYPRGNQ